jgi:YfiH family protein
VSNPENSRPLLCGTPRLIGGPVEGGITTRIGFPPAVQPGPDDPSRAAGRALLARLIRIPPERLAWVRQVHGSTALSVENAGCHGDADGLVTTEANLALLVSVADCGPVLLFDETNGVIAAAHAGWRGTVAGICERTVETMVAVGADPSRLRAWVGPCIGPTEFEVGEEVAERFEERFVQRHPGSRPHVDLPAAIVHRLEAGGLATERIAIAGQCTVRLSDRYWSYRRDGGICGRQLAWIVRGAVGRAAI